MSTPNSRNAQRLQTPGRGLVRAKWAAGTVSLIALAGLFVTSLVRAPNPVFSVIVAVAALGLLAAMVAGARRGRHRPPHLR
ncbi:hypothetical protein ACVGOW_20110 [Pseudonocardia saturnea]